MEGEDPGYGDHLLWVGDRLHETDARATFEGWNHPLPDVNLYGPVTDKSVYCACVDVKGLIDRDLVAFHLTSGHGLVLTAFRLGGDDEIETLWQREIPGTFDTPIDALCIEGTIVIRDGIPDSARDTPPEHDSGQSARTLVSVDGETGAVCWMASVGAGRMARTESMVVVQDKSQLSVIDPVLGREMDRLYLSSAGGWECDPSSDAILYCDTEGFSTLAFLGVDPSLLVRIEHRPWEMVSCAGGRLSFACSDGVWDSYSLAAISEVLDI